MRHKEEKEKKEKGIMRNLRRTEIGHVVGGKRGKGKRKSDLRDFHAATKERKVRKGR